MNPLDQALCVRAPQGLWLVARAILSALPLLATAPTAFSRTFTVTLEAPKIQQSSLFTNPTGFGASNVIVDSFDELKAGFISKPVPFAANAALGSYDHLLVRSADAFGGAGGKGTYMTANTNYQRRFQFNDPGISNTAAIFWPLVVSGRPQ